jgi:hypothetical protein
MGNTDRQRTAWEIRELVNQVDAFTFITRGHFQFRGMSVMYI